MTSAHMQEWIDALRSGDYQQATGSLCVTEIDDSGIAFQTYCCLGVAESIRLDKEDPSGGLPDPELAAWLGIEIDPITRAKKLEWDPCVDIPKEIAVAELLEVLGEPISDSDSDLGSLLSTIRSARYGVPATALNDEHKLSFVQIANLIEAFGIKEDAE